MQNQPPTPITGLLFGLAIGDALGVPVEFKSRHTLKASPVTDMMGYGTHDQTPGTWSDDSSLTFCLAENLCADGDLADLAKRFVNWYDWGYWTAHYEVFDVGNATRIAIDRLRTGVEPTLAGGTEESSNGNGSLMRILPLAYFLSSATIETRYEQVKNVSSLTHAHMRSILCCFIAVEWAIHLLKGATLEGALETAQESVKQFISKNGLMHSEETSNFQRLLHLNAMEWKRLEEESIQSSGYVIHTLEASIWCLLTTNDYPSAVLKAVNLGGDTDTTAAVTGGLAGLFYGAHQIPESWLQQLARRAAIQDLADRCTQKISTPC